MLVYQTHMTTSACFSFSKHAMLTGACLQQNPSYTTIVDE